MFMSMATMRPTGPLKSDGKPRSGSFSVAGAGGLPPRSGTQSASVLPVICGLSRSDAGCSSVGEQPS